jgi:hypothetical protein
MPSGLKRKASSTISRNAQSNHQAKRAELAYVPSTEASEECPITTIVGHTPKIPWLSEAMIASALPVQIIDMIQSSKVSQPSITYCAVGNVLLTLYLQSAREWSGKVRWFIATLFYHARVISDDDFDRMFDYLIPHEHTLIDSHVEKITVRRYLSELQSDICQSHERVARAWLNGPKGQEFTQLQDTMRSVIT